jgi:hypothetical protein
MVLPCENAGIVEGKFYILRKFWSQTWFQKYQITLLKTNFLINKVKNRGKFLVTSYLHGTNMGVSSPKGLECV